MEANRHSTERTRHVGSGRGRGRGRGGGGKAPARRVMMAWSSEDDDDEDGGGGGRSRGRGRGPTSAMPHVDVDGTAAGRSTVTAASGKKKNKKKNKKSQALVPESEEEDEEWDEDEIDNVVELAAMEVFAGSMIVDADDVFTKRAMKSVHEPSPAQLQKAAKRKEAKAAQKAARKAATKAKIASEQQQVGCGESSDPQTTAEVAHAHVESAALPLTKKQKQKAKLAKVKQERREQTQQEAMEATQVLEKKTKKKKKAGESSENASSNSEPKPSIAQVETKKKKSNKESSKHLGKDHQGDEPVINASKARGASKSEQHGKSRRPGSVDHANGDDKPIRGDLFKEYLSRDDAMAALERGTLFQGKLRVNPRYRMRAFLSVDGIPVDVLVDGMRDRNRAMDGDLVVVEMLPEDKWKPLDDADKDKGFTSRASKRGSDEDSGESARKRAVALNALWRPALDTSKCFLPGKAASEQQNPGLANATTIHQRGVLLKRRPTAAVVCILSSGSVQGLVGSLEPKTKPASGDSDAPLSPDDDYAFFQAHDTRVPRGIRIPRLQLPDEFVQHPTRYAREMLCFCRITKWSVRHDAPVGEFVKTLGEYSGIESGISSILMRHGLLEHTLDFRREILDQLDERYGLGGEKWKIPDDESAKRRDFRSEQIFSIDPYNARDLDDALHIRALDEAETCFEVGVHIADVTHFIERGSYLDQEAQSRATSVYLANRVLPMLPRVLCERLCSLQPQVDRLAFSVVWQMNADGSLVDGCEPWFGKSIIRSCCKLDYGTAQRMLDGVVTAEKLDEWEEDRRPIPGDNASITPSTVIQSVRYLWRVAQNRRLTRFETGAVSLQNVKLTFTLDEKGNPTSFGTYQLKNSNRLVEEYMLLANYLVAQRLLQAHGPLAFIRHHPEPNERALETTLATLSENQIELDASTPKTLTDSLERVQSSMGQNAHAVVQNMITKPMKPAEYIVAGNAGSEAGWRHYALNIPYYTHFTSPIRRYADVVVHRLLQESVVEADQVAARTAERGEDVTKLMLEMGSAAQNCNEKKMTSKNAEKESDQVFLCAYVKHHGAVDVTGVIVSCGQRSLTVYIPELGLEQRLELKDLGVNGSWNEKTKTLSVRLGSGKKTRRGKNKSKSDPKKMNMQEKESKSERAGPGQVEESRHAESVQAEEGSDKGMLDGITRNGEPAAPERVELKFLSTLRLRMLTTDRMPLALKFVLADG